MSRGVGVAKRCVECGRLLHVWSGKLGGEIGLVDAEPFIAWFTERGIVWFRLFGYGMHWKNTLEHALTFSERTEIRRHWMIGAWRIRILTPE